MKQTGVSLGGGSLRGVAHIGALKELIDNGLEITHIAGTSAGSVIGGLFACGMEPGKMKDVVRDLSIRRHIDRHRLQSKRLDQRRSHLSNSTKIDRWKAFFRFGYSIFGDLCGSHLWRNSRHQFRGSRTCDSCKYCHSRFVFPSGN